MIGSSAKREKEDALVEQLREIVGDENVLSEPDELLVYECDGLPQHKHPPLAVVFPGSTEETAEALALLSEKRVSFAPRGAGTGLSGGALAIDRGVVIEMARMRRILRVDPENRIAVVQTGLVNAHLSRAVANYGLYYVPDPSSQPSCTIGGNIAENAGGIHCLKYGTTTDHVIGARVVLSDGAVVDLDLDLPGYDLLGTFVGSEGTFGIATEATVKLARMPQAIRTLLADFIDVDDASRAVSAIIAGGILPAALEMMDHEIIRAVEASVFAAGLPIDAKAVLLVELDGIEAGIDDEAEKVEAILREHNARSVRRAQDEHERKKLWAARKGAFGAVGRLMPDVMIQDAVVPRSRLPEVLAETYRISAQHKLQLANVFHAGDGNLHPLICFDLRRGDELERVRQAGREIMETCVRAGGSITGEHGVGLDKSVYLPLIFSDDDMDLMLQVRTAFDPSGLCNPGKIIPTPRGCGEARAVATQSLSEPPVANSLSGASGSMSSLTAARIEDAKAEDIARIKPRTTIGKALLASRMNEARVARELSRVAGERHVRRLTDFTLDLSAGDRAERIFEVAPESAERASEILKFATTEGLAVIPAGSKSWLNTGNLLSRADLILTSCGLPQAIEHEPADLVATASAGLTLAEFQRHLGKSGQWLPIDPPNDHQATLGGVVATASGGPQSFGYGLLRSYVIGMRTVLADGRLIRAGGKVVKNVAGYDLCKLFTGSYGTLGFITELTFKLRPLPAEVRTVLAFGTLDSLVSVGRRLTQEFSPVAVELASAGLARQIGLKAPKESSALLVRFAGPARAVIFQTAQALKLLRENSKHQCEIVEDDEALWSKLNAVPFEFSEHLCWRARVQPTSIASFINGVNEAVKDEAAAVAQNWHAGLGDGRFQAMAKAPMNHRGAVRTLENLRSKAENLGGHLVLETAPVEIKNELNSWGSFGSAGELMKRVKEQLDPQNVLAPGRFVR